MEKPRLNFWQIWNMSFGFFGIQFGWVLQMSNMGPIYEYLGKTPKEIPLLFLAAPLTGLIVQPIIGYMSDRTWHPRWGRRRPYFFIGAILSSIALLLMPNSGVWWMAAGLLWILDSSINISMEPFRAFVADKLPENQRTRGFAMQSFFIGGGSVIAAALPWLMTHVFYVQNADSSGAIPNSIKFSFYIGSFAFFFAVLYTVLTTKEYPPTDISAFQKAKETNKGFGAGFKEIISSVRHMPKRMQQLALVQFFTWPGLFLMWFYYSSAVGFNIFGATSEKSPEYTDGVEFAGLTLSYYNLITFLFALIIPFIAKKYGRKQTHFLCLMAGAVGLLTLHFITNKYFLFVSMTGVGIAWASILSMPYAMLAGCLPEKKVGIYMGIFNFFIVLPEIIATLTFGWIMSHLLNENRLLGVETGGFLLIIAAILSLRVDDSPATEAVSTPLAMDNPDPNILDEEIRINPQS